MNKSLAQIGAGLFLAAFLAGCSQQVQTGEIVSCKKCGKEISNTVTVISVPPWNADQYHVSRSQTYCQSCGDELVAFSVHTRCQKCGRTYETHQENAPRRDEPRDRSKTEGFCSDGCAKEERIDHAIDRVSQKTGDVIGRIGRGLFDGIKNHTR